MRKHTKARGKMRENAGNAISGPLHFKIFWGGGMPPDPPILAALLLGTLPTNFICPAT